MSDGPLWPLVVYFALALVVAGGMLGLSYILGERHHAPAMGDPYESGMEPTGWAGGRFDVRFYVIAMAFVIFDLESMFVFAWAVALRRAGWSAYLEMTVFIAVLLVTLVYLLRVGAFDWGRNRQRGRGTPLAIARDPGAGDVGPQGGPAGRPAPEPQQ